MACRLIISLANYLAFLICDLNREILDQDSQPEFHKNLLKF